MQNNNLDKDYLNFFLKKYNPSKEQIEKFSLYINYLLSENLKYNLTAITDPKDICKYHILDALSAHELDFFIKSKNILDVGTGCGVPGIILSIMNPDKTFYLMEVIQKRILFLKNCINILNLKNCVIIENDFKTFIRKTKYSIDIFLSRASLHIKDLIFIYNGKSEYKNSLILYWSSNFWKEKEITEYKNCIFKEYNYNIEDKKRNLVLIKNII